MDMKDKDMMVTSNYPKSSMMTLLKQIQVNKSREKMNFFQLKYPLACIILTTEFNISFKKKDLRMFFTSPRNFFSL